MDVEPLYTGSIPSSCPAPDGPVHSFPAISLNLTRDRENPVVLLAFCVSCKQLVEIELERIVKGTVKT